MNVCEVAQNTIFRHSRVTFVTPVSLQGIAVRAHNNGVDPQRVNSRNVIRCNSTTGNWVVLSGFCTNMPTKFHNIHTKTNGVSVCLFHIVFMYELVLPQNGGLDITRTETIAVEQNKRERSISLGCALKGGFYLWINMFSWYQWNFIHIQHSTGHGLSHLSHAAVIWQ